MSRYAWERGTLKIPTATWVELKREVREAYNQVIDAQFSRCQRLYGYLTAAAKGQRNFDYLAEVRRIEYGEVPTLRAQADWEPEQDYRVFQSWSNNREKARPKRPLRKDFPPANTSTTVFQLGEASITFNEKEHTVTWSVPDNNHAVERAREHPVAEAFFRALSRIKWTRGSGGTLIGNDEYNRDSSHEGGGANYVTERFGPLGEDPWEKELRKKAAKNPPAVPYLNRRSYW